MSQCTLANRDICLPCVITHTQQTSRTAHLLAQQQVVLFFQERDALQIAQDLSLTLWMPRSNKTDSSTATPQGDVGSDGSGTHARVTTHDIHVQPNTTQRVRAVAIRTAFNRPSPSRSATLNWPAKSMSRSTIAWCASTCRNQIERHRRHSFHDKPLVSHAYIALSAPKRSQNHSRLDARHASHSTIVSMDTRSI